MNSSKKLISATKISKGAIGDILDDIGGKLPLLRLIIVISLITMIATSALTIKDRLAGYRDIVDEGRQDAGRLVSTAAKHIRLTFNSVDTALKRAIDREYFFSLYGGDMIEDMQNHFTHWVNKSPNIVSMAIISTDGRVKRKYAKRGYKDWLDGQESTTRNEHFTFHTDSSNPDELHISPAQTDFEKQKNIITISRRLKTQNGSFGGVMVVGIDGGAVLKFLDGIKTGQHTSFILMQSRRNVVLLSQVEDAAEKSLMFEAMKSQPRRAGQATADYVIYDSGIDDSFRIYGFHNIIDMDFVLAVIKFEQDVSSSWKEEQEKDFTILGIVSFFILMISALAISMLRQMHRASKSEAIAISASMAKSEFLANMSHELRTPLNAILGFTEMLQSDYFGDLNSKQKERLDDVHRCGEHLLLMINDILEFSKGEAGKIVLQTERFNISSVVKDTISIIKERMEPQKLACIDIEVDGQEDMEDVLASKTKVIQIILNLLSNSIKFSLAKEGVDEENPAQITLSYKTSDKGGWLLCVKDDGIGMKEQDIAIALSAFGQVHDKTDIEGTGLGLPLCQMFVELHGGEMTVTSQENVGTEVCIYFPAKCLAE